MASRTYSRFLIAAVSFIAIAVFLGNISMPSAFAGTAIKYNYDAVGNIISIKHDDQSLAIYSFSPTTGPVGSIVTIHGNLFSNVADQNIVSFNSIPASILSATETTLIVRVPQNATTGPISVSVQGEMVYSESDFVVADEGGGPVIYDFWPKCGVAGDVIEVIGDHFDPEENATSVSFAGNTLTVEVINTKNLKFIIPANTGASHIQVLASSGTATSSDILAIPPAGSLTCQSYSLGFIQVEPGDTLSLSAHAGQRAGILFDVKAGELLTFQFSEIETNAPRNYFRYIVYDAGRNALASGWSLNETYTTFHIPYSTEDATYLLDIYSEGAVAPLSFHASLETDPWINTNGDALSISTDHVNQTTRLGFRAEKDEVIGIGFSGIQEEGGNPATIMTYLYGTDNKQTGTVSCYKSYGICEYGLLPVNTSGMYSIVLKPLSSPITKITATATRSEPVSLFSHVSLNHALPAFGEKGHFVFEAQAGQTAALSFSNLIIDHAQSHWMAVKIANPDGSTLKQQSFLKGANGAGGGGVLNLGALPQAGTYHIYTSPYYGAPASFDVFLTLE